MGCRSASENQEYVVSDFLFGQGSAHAVFPAVAGPASTASQRIKAAKGPSLQALNSHVKKRVGLSSTLFMQSRVLEFAPVISTCPAFSGGRMRARSKAVSRRDKIDRAVVKRAFVGVLSEEPPFRPKILCGSGLAQESQDCAGRRSSPLAYSRLMNIRIPSGWKLH